MYEKLIAELREYWNDGTEDLRNQAADALEELTAEREEVVSKVVRTFTYKGITLKEWADRYLNPRTNADRIRSMTDEELATFLFNNVSCSDCTMHGGGCSIDCEKWMLSWLKSPVKGAE